jgi:hypothetical protein
MSTLALSIGTLQRNAAHITDKFTSRDFLRGDFNVLSKNVTRGVSQSEKTLII